MRWRSCATGMQRATGQRATGIPARTCRGQREAASPALRYNAGHAGGLTPSPAARFIVLARSTGSVSSSVSAAATAASSSGGARQKRAIASRRRACWRPMSSKTDFATESGTWLRRQFLQAPACSGRARARRRTIPRGAARTGATAAAMLHKAVYRRQIKRTGQFDRRPCDV